MKHTPLTKEMVRSFPGTNIHVHVPGTVSAQTALELGLKNGLVEIDRGKIISLRDIPKLVYFRSYADMFRIITPQNGDLLPQVEYNLPPGDFDKFDEVMALVQGHRYGTGGWRTPQDYMYCMQTYLHNCLANNLKVIKIQQNIEVAHHLFGEATHAARRRFFEMLVEVKQSFADAGIYLSFLNCYNKSMKASSLAEVEEMSARAGEYLVEAINFHPGLYVGIQSAGNEKKPGAHPKLHIRGYDKARDKGALLDSHAGEAAGAEYIVDTMRYLDIDELGHAFQIVESPSLIEYAQESGLLITSMPVINDFLGAKIHVDRWGEPTIGGRSKVIENIWQHPFWDMLRQHKLNVAIATDNPAMGGQPTQETIMRMAGLKPRITGPVPEHMLPLSAEEYCICALNSITSRAFSPEVKTFYINQVEHWMKANSITVEHHLLEKKFTNREFQRDPLLNGKGFEAPNMAPPR